MNSQNEAIREAQQRKPYLVPILDKSKVRVPMGLAISEEEKDMLETVRKHYGLKSFSAALRFLIIREYHRIKETK